jgi:hypothetical protein
MTEFFADEPNFPGPEEPVPQPPQPELPRKEPAEPELPSPDPENPPFPGPGPTRPVGMFSQVSKKSGASRQQRFAAAMATKPWGRQSQEPWPMRSGGPVPE